jgi:hypothetical protein
MADTQPRRNDTPLLALHMKDAQAKWDRLTPPDLEGVRTKAELIARLEERYGLPHDVAAQDVEIWGLGRRF